jgi:acyl carrier protein
MTNTEERVCRLVAHDLAIIQEQVGLSSRLAIDLRADSLDRITIAMSMEEAFRIDVDDAAVEAAATVADLVTIVDTARGAKVAA